MKGFIAGAFDGCHAGHLIAFKKAKKHCSHLTIGLHVNPHIERDDKNKPVETVSERMIKLRGIKYVDDIIPYETESELKELILMLQTDGLDLLFMGSDWIGKNHWYEKLDIPIIYLDRFHNQSSTNLRKRNEIHAKTI